MDSETLTTTLDPALASFAFFDRLHSEVMRGEYDVATSRLSPLLSLNRIEARGAAREWLERLTILKVDSTIDSVDKCGFALSCDIATSAMPGYASLDDHHIDDIARITARIESYLADSSNTRPLNFLMLASPGAGKSHFISCVAKTLTQQNVAAVTFNMATMSSYAELAKPLDEARNVKVDDKIPLLFLDEFDADPAHLNLLLPLLWDGTVTLGQRDLRLGKSIIVLAGSSQSLPDALSHARSMRSDLQLPEGTNPKLIDLFSRINGAVVRIPPFFDATLNIDRRTDKVAVAIELLRRRFGRSLHVVPLGLLRLIAVLNFRYDVRSISHLINEIPLTHNAPKISWDSLSFPLQTTEALRASSLVYHLVDEDNSAHGAVNAWNAASRHLDPMVLPSDDLFACLRGPDQRLGIAFLLNRIQSLIGPT